MNVDLARVAEGITHTATAFMAWRLTRPTHPHHAPQLRPLFWFLGLTLASDGLRLLGQTFVLRNAERPFTGAARVVFYVDQAGVIGWSAGLLAVVVLAFFGRDRASTKLAPIASFAAGATIAFALAYPELRGDKLGHAYTVLEVATVLACIGITSHAWFRDRWFGVAARSVTILVAGEIATLLGPFLGEPFTHWTTANAISAVTYLALAKELRTSAIVRT